MTAVSLLARALLSIGPEIPQQGENVPSQGFWTGWWGYYWWAIVALIGLAAIGYFVATAHRRLRPLGVRQ